jgi:hypothetical protein
MFVVSRGKFRKGSVEFVAEFSCDNICIVRCLPVAAQVCYGITKILNFALDIWFAHIRETSYGID